MGCYATSFSAGVTKHHGQEHLMEETVYLGLRFQRDRAHPMRQCANSQRKHNRSEDLGEHILINIPEAGWRRQEVRQS